jgi:hypothetical protein
MDDSQEIAPVLSPMKVIVGLRMSVLAFNFRLLESGCLQNHESHDRCHNAPTLSILYDKGVQDRDRQS